MLKSKVLFLNEQDSAEHLSLERLFQITEYVATLSGTLIRITEEAIQENIYFVL